MVSGTTAREKMTVSLPREIVRYLGEKAAESKISRSQVIANALAEKKAREEEELAAEGYRFYADEAREFAAASLRAMSDVVGRGG